MKTKSIIVSFYNIVANLNHVKVRCEWAKLYTVLTVPRVRHWEAVDWNAVREYRTESHILSCLLVNYAIDYGRRTDGCLHSWQISCRRCCSCCRCYWCCCCCCMFFLCSAAGETLSTVSPVYFRRTCQQVTGRDHAECCRLKSIFLILLACPTELWHLQSCRRTFASRGNRKTDVERHAKRKRWYKHEIMNREIITGCCSNGSERISIAKHNFLWLINWHIAIF